MRLPGRFTIAVVLVSWAHPVELTLFASSPGERHRDRKSRALAASGLVSVAAGIRPIVRSVIRVIRAIEAVAVVTAAEATSSGAKVIVVQARHMIAAKATDVISTKPSNAIAAEAADVTPAEATDVASTETAHVTSAKTTHVAPATAMSSTSAAGLRACGNKAAGKNCACQNHHHSSSHDILHLRWAEFPPQDPVRRWRASAK
jgi:hypothetical protein